MKVKIGYSVEFNEVPMNTSRVLERSKDIPEEICKLQNLCIDLLKTSESLPSSKTVLLHLSRIKESIEELERNITDASAILLGYCDVLVKQENTAEASKTQEKTDVNEG